MSSHPLLSSLRPLRPGRLVLLALCAALSAGANCSGGGNFHEARGTQLFASPQARPLALSPTRSQLYVVNTPAGTLDVVDTGTRKLLRSIEVGLEPVGVAVKPDGSEVWVANHVSDSVSVVDVAAGSPTEYQVVETIDAVDPASLVTDFDEPVGVAFASNAKAYVTLSSRNAIAVVDAAAYEVTATLPLNAQEPRDLQVRGGRLYVPVFESGNQSEASNCPSPPFTIDFDQCTFDLATSNFAADPSLTTVPIDVVKDPDVPDRDLFVFDTATDTQVQVVSGIGTLLYGVAVDGQGKVFIAQTDARNADNGRAGTQGQGLADLGDRLFLNQVGVVDCGGGSCGAPSRFELEPLPPAQPAAGEQLATPFGIEVSGDDQVLVLTAAASHRLATVDATTGAVLGRVDVGHLPRGVALQSDANGAPQTAWVMNALDNTVSEVDVSNPAAPVVVATIPFSADPTPDAVRRGRIAFESAAGSTTGTFACASCHPDGNTDQLLWVIGAQCNFSAGCNQEEPRSTMPVRGLRDTLPLHWDGTLGDPFGGPDGESGTAANLPPDCASDQACFRHLVDAAISGVMCLQGGCPTDQDELGLPGAFSEAEREDMASFLQSVAYPPARSRRPDDQVSAQAIAGFEDFFQNQGGTNPPGPGGTGPETCADAPGGCHALPLGVSTNSPFVGAFEAPTMRGITDRFTEFSAGITNVEDQLVVTPFFSEVIWDPSIGYDEFTVWASAFGAPGNQIGFRGGYNVGAFNIFEMIEEMSTGHSGALGRQVTLNTRTTDATHLALTEATLSTLENADAEGVVNLRGAGVRNGTATKLSFKPSGLYENPNVSLSHAQLVAEAQAGTLVFTFTAAQRNLVNANTVQPLLSVPPVTTDPNLEGRPDLPQLPADHPFVLEGLHVNGTASVFVDGAKVSAQVECLGGTFAPDCDSGQLRITLASPPTATGMHLLQVQNPSGLLSDELPFLVQ